MQLKMFDGAMGTMLQQAGVADKPCPEYACITNPEVVASIHRAILKRVPILLKRILLGQIHLNCKNMV